MSRSIKKTKLSREKKLRKESIRKQRI